MDNRSITKIKIAANGSYEIHRSGQIEMQNGQSFNASGSEKWDLRSHPDFMEAYRRFCTHAAAAHARETLSSERTFDEFEAQEQELISIISVKEISFQEKLSGDAILIKYTVLSYDGNHGKCDTPPLRLGDEMITYPFSKSLEQHWYTLSDEAEHYIKMEKFNVEAEEEVPQPKLFDDGVGMDPSQAEILEEQVMN